MNKNYISSILLIFAKGKQNKVKSLNTLLMYVHIKIMLQQYFHMLSHYMKIWMSQNNQNNCTMFFLNNSNSTICQPLASGIRFTIYYKFNNHPTQSESDKKSGEFEFVKNYVLKCKMFVSVRAPNHCGLSGLSTPLSDPPRRFGSPVVEYTLSCGTGCESVGWCCL